VAEEVTVFYYRNGCHLCEELAALLFRCWPQQAEKIEWRDVDQDAEWRQAYGQLVPVLMRGDDTICTLHPDLPRITRYFGAMTNPV